MLNSQSKNSTSDERSGSHVFAVKGLVMRNLKAHKSPIEPRKEHYEQRFFDRDLKWPIGRKLSPDFALRDYSKN